jgi:peptidoglycan/LPS O-acetylase OafA/YrhL
VLALASVGVGSGLLKVAAAFFASILVAMLFYRFIEKPVTRGLHRLMGLRPSRGAQTLAP